MDHVIEAILNDAVERAAKLPFDEQSYVYSELSDRFIRLSHDALMAEYGLRKEG